MMGRNIFLGLIISFLLVFIIETAPGNVEAVGEPLAEIRWNAGQEVQEAEVPPGQHGCVIFTGVVNCELVAGSPYQKVVVSLTATSEQGWSPIVEPPQITFNPSTDSNVPFNVTVTVPSETSFYQTDTITVSGEAVTYPGVMETTIDPITATIKIKQFYNFSIKCAKPEQEAWLNSKLTYKLKINNNGNGRDEFLVKIMNSDELAENDIQISLNQTQIEIEEKSVDVIEIQIQISSSEISLGNHQIELCVKSIYGYGNNEFPPQFLTLKLKVSISDVSNDVGETGETGVEEYKPKVDGKGNFLPGFEVPFLAVGLIIILMITNRNRKQIKGKIL